MTKTFYLESRNKNAFSKITSSGFEFSYAHFMKLICTVIFYNSSNIVKPWHQTLHPKTPKPKTKGPWADNAGGHPPTHLLTLEHEGGVKFQNGSPYLSSKKRGSERKDMD